MGKYYCARIVRQKILNFVEILFLPFNRKNMCTNFVSTDYKYLCHRMPHFPCGIEEIILPVTCYIYAVFLSQWNNIKDARFSLILITACSFWKQFTFQAVTSVHSLHHNMYTNKQIDHRCVGKSKLSCMMTPWYGITYLMAYNCLVILFSKVV